MIIPEYVYEDWRQFKAEILDELFGGNPFNRGKYIFRGQSDSDWPLEPSFDRAFKFLEKKDQCKAMSMLIKTFKKESENIDVPGDVWKDEIKTLSLGQHYGLPTRLLDWTESPYMAAFFAFCESITYGASSDYVAIWAINTTVENVWNAESGVQIVKVPSIGNIRIRNQFGLFTVLKTPDNCLDDYVSNFDEDPKPLLKFIIRSDAARDAIADLDAMAINHARIYPGLSGCSQAAKIRVLLNFQNT